MAEDYVWIKVADGHERLVPKDQAVAMKAMEKIRGAHGQRGLGGAKVVLTEAEKKSLFNYIGEHVEDAQDARRKMKAKGLRFAEKGETGFDLYDALIEHAETGNKLDEKFQFGNMDVFGDQAKIDERARKFDIHERFRYHAQRLGLGS